MNDTLRNICDEIIGVLAPLVDAAQSPVGIQKLLADLGWAPSAIPQPLTDLADAGVELIAAVGADDGSVSSDDAFQAVAHFISAINTIAAKPDNLFPGGIDVAIFKATIGRELLDYAVVEYLLTEWQPIGGLLKLAGLIRLIDTPAAGQRSAFLKRVVQWQEIGQLFSNPKQGFTEVYGWGASTANLGAALADLTSILESFDIELDMVNALGSTLAFINAGAVTVPDYAFGSNFELGGFIELPPAVSAGVTLALRPPTASRGAALCIMPHAQLKGTASIDLTDRLSLTIGGNADFSNGTAITLAAGQPPELRSGYLTGAAATNDEIRFGLNIHPVAGESELILLGAADQTRFSIAGFDFTVGGKVLDPARIEAAVELALRNARVVIKPADGEADSFITKFLPDGGIDVALSFGLRLSSISGFQFTGSGGLQVSIPAHLQIGPVDIDSITLELDPQDHGLAFAVGAAVSGTLGPLEVAVDGAGLKFIVQFPDPPQGNLGPFDVLLGFKPPKGIGLAIDAGVVQGGGYLYIDTDHGEYAGALELVVADWLTLTAIGLISTQMPDGSKGFSLLVIITADFGTGIQLGFGFTLVGVGGLLGLNRTMLFQPLMDGVRTGAINGILFPTDIIANAPKIISDLKAIFPPKEGTFLIGPMAKLGWGSPPLITLSLGVIIEIPPGDIAILGVLSLAIPDDDPVLILQVNFAGALEFSKQRLYFFAALFDSHILTITIDGEIAVLFAYGADANLVLSVGGFHPQFNPPPLPTPIPKRIQLDIINEQYARIRCGGYFAATTNTLQFGAYADLYFGFSAVSVTGHMTFDLLMQWSPLHLITQVTTTFSAQVFGVGVFGVDIDVSVEGPTPWHIHGHGSISFLFFSVSIPIDKTFGDAPPTSLPPIAVLPLIGTELGKRANWKAALPDGSSLLVTLRQLDPTEEAMVLHPVGTLQVSQRAVPLNLTIDKVGAQKPSDANYFKVDVISAGLVKANDLFEPFAPAQFKDYDDAAKLSQPAYSPQHSGVELSAAGGALASGTSIGRQMRYALTIVDTNYRRFSHRFYQLINPLFVHFLGGGSVTFNSLSAASNQLLHPPGEKITAGEESYTVANQSDNHAYGANPLTFSSRTAAQDYLDRAVRGNPILAGKLHVLPQFEVTP